MGLIWRPGFQFDIDASAYIEAVEAADTQALETGVRYAINNFVIGCKQDGIWDAIKASCILAGARTLNGALVPLVGTAPTSFSFVAGDYNRETGLLGDGSTKYVNTNRSNNADPQNSKHFSVYVTSSITVSGCLICTSTLNDSGDSYFYQGVSPSVFNVKINDAGNGTTIASAVLSGFAGASRASGSVAAARLNGASYSVATASVSALDESLILFGVSPYITNARLSFYSIGEALDLAALDGRVTDLMTAIGAAIP